MSEHLDSSVTGDENDGSGERKLVLEQQVNELFEENKSLRLRVAGLESALEMAKIESPQNSDAMYDEVCLRDPITVLKLLADMEDWERVTKRLRRLDTESLLKLLSNVDNLKKMMLKVSARRLPDVRQGSKQ